MRRRHPLLSLVLAAALLTGQWLAGMHAEEHALQPTAHACAVCLHADSSGAGALPAVPHLVVDGVVATPDSTAAASPLAAILCHHPIRGPPALPA
jgi:hypothetical protein